MTRFGMVIDLDKCSGCQACTVACAVENNLSPGGPELAAAGRLMRWVQLLPTVEGEYPHLSAEVTPVMCQHCGRPPCTMVCPVSATYLSPDGIIAQIYWRCIGCRYCVNACPYTIKMFNWFAPNFDAGQLTVTNPDVEVRDRGITEKCSFCVHRMQAAKERARTAGRPMRPGEYVTACAEACPAKAILFGDLDDPESEVAVASKGPRATHLLEELGTRPKVTYLKRRS